MFLGPASKYEGLFEVPFPTPGESSRPRDWTHIYSHFLSLLALAGRFFTASTAWEAPLTATSPKVSIAFSLVLQRFSWSSCPSDTLEVVNIWCLLGRAPTAPVLAWKSEALPLDTYLMSHMLSLLQSYWPGFWHSHVPGSSLPQSLWTWCLSSNQRAFPFLALALNSHQSFLFQVMSHLAWKALSRILLSHKKEQNCHL